MINEKKIRFFKNIKIDLNEYFNKNQFVCCTVVETNHIVNKSTVLRLSIRPSDIYANLQGCDIKNRMLLWGSITSEEDYGYEINFGSKLLKGFLKSKLILNTIVKYNRN